MELSRSDQAETYEFQEALRSLGVNETTLTEEEKRSIDENGFVILYNMVNPEWLEHLREDYEKLMEEKYGRRESVAEGSQFGIPKDGGFHEQGARRLTDLVSESLHVDGIYTHPRLLAAAYHHLRRPIHLSDLAGRDALPGAGHQALHSDRGPRETVLPFYGINSAWLLDDFTADNGPTRVVPGTHLRVELPGQDGSDPLATHPDEVQVIAPAGSVIFFSCHLWHGGTRNNTDQPRRSIFCTIAPRDIPQVPSQRERIRKSVYDRISPAARYILDV